MTQMNNDAEQTQVNYPGNSEAHARDVTGAGQKNDLPKEVVSPPRQLTSKADDSSIAEDEWAWLDEVLSNSYFNIAKTKATIKQRFQQQAQTQTSNDPDTCEEPDCNRPRLLFEHFCEVHVKQVPVTLEPARPTHPQGADGELDSLRCHHDERRGLLLSSPPQCLCEYCGNAWVYETTPPICPVLKKAFDVGVSSVIKEHHEPQPVGDGDIDVSNKLGDGELRERIDQILFSVKSWNYGGEGAARQKTALDEIMTLIAAQTDAAQHEAKANTEFNLMTELGIKLMPLLIHTTQEDFPAMTGELLRDMNKWQKEKFKSAYAELQHLKSQESEKE